MYTVLLCFVLLWLPTLSSRICATYQFIFSRVTSLALGQSYDCPSASEATQKDMNKWIIVIHLFISFWVASLALGHWELILWPQQNEAKHNLIHIPHPGCTLCHESAKEPVHKFQASKFATYCFYVVVEFYKRSLKLSYLQTICERHLRAKRFHNS